MDYSEFEPDDPEETKYDACYNIDDVWVQMYFLDDVCVRLRAISFDSSYGLVQTVRGLQSRGTYSQMVGILMKHTHMQARSLYDISILYKRLYLRIRNIWGR